MRLIETILKLHKDLPRAKTPHEQESLLRHSAATDRHMDQLVYELYELAAEETRIEEGSGK